MSQRKIVVLDGAGSNDQDLEPLEQSKRSGPPVRHVVSALEMTAACLANGLPVPAEAVRIIASKHVPFALWNRLYICFGGRSFKKLAAKNGITKDKLLAQPYAA